MWRKSSRTPRTGQTAILFLISALIGLSLAAAPARAQGGWQSGFASIVVDAKTGNVIKSSNSDALRHPASLAKVMTLYLLFAELEAGRLKLDSRIKMTSQAARQPPSKLGLAAGQTISVEDAIKSLVTRSANDIAVAIAEAIAGDEESFARLMTSRARTLGMMRTVFKNASGLPHVRQVTTAREMALLGISIQERFPKYFHYFSVRNFKWRGTNIRNHNRLLGNVAGVTGLKTGYTRASGYNLISTVKRDHREIVAVVLGGRTGAARDSVMRDLIAGNIRHASTGPRTAPPVAEVPLPVPHPLESAANRRSQPAPGFGGPIQPRSVRTVQVGKGGEEIAEGDRSGSAELSISTLSAERSQMATRMIPAQPSALAPDGKFVTFAPPPPPPAFAAASAQVSPEIDRPGLLAALALAPEAPPPPSAAPMRSVVVPVQRSELAEAGAETSADAAGIPTSAPVSGGWVIQVGAYTAEEQARDRLAQAIETASRILANVNPYTETTTRGSTKYYRARFAGFDENGARQACAALKRNDFACFAAKN